LLTQYFDYLEQARLLNLLRSNRTGITALQKPDKIYLENTNLLFAIAPENTDTGNLRETFFLNQLRHRNKVNYPQIGDFLVNDRYVFEVGGRNKGGKQVKSIEEAYLAVDDTEVGSGKVIPLWLFGFLY
jgi:uncharacterized protein